MNTQSMDMNTRTAALNNALAQITKQFGQGSIFKLGENNTLDVEAISTGSLKLDAALGIGGLPVGRVTEIFGHESSGKTTLTLELIASAQSQGKTCAFIDVEHALDPVYAKKVGVDVDKLLISQPDYAEQALEICDTLTSSGAVDVIVIDSVAALTPKSELEGEMGDASVGVAARLMSQGLRKLTGNIKKNNTVVVFINQLRHKIGISFGNPEVTTGGNALKFYSSVRLDIRRTGAIKDGEDVIGNQTRIKVVKNKVAPPFKEINTEIYYGSGFNPIAELFDIAVENKLIDKAGTWYSYKDSKLGQGRSNSIDYIAKNDELIHELKSRLDLTNS